MTRDAKLYFLKDVDWKPLAQKIEQHSDFELKTLITIFQLMSANSHNQTYAIISLSENIDRMVENYGAKEMHEKNYLRDTLHDYFDEPLYGQKSNLLYLNKMS